MQGAANWWQRLSESINHYGWSLFGGILQFYAFDMSQYCGKFCMHRHTGCQRQRLVLQRLTRWFYSYFTGGES